MKKYSLILFFQLLFVSIYAQFANYITFDSEIETQQIQIDTLNPDNVWQIGSPQKEIFTSALTPPNCIITDTISTYPTNSVSTFTVTHYKDFGDAWGLGIGFGYQSDMDSLNDYGYIEYSVNGEAWLNLTDTLFQLGRLESPIFTGSKEYDGVEFVLYDIVEPYSYDSIQYRFVFISDDVETNQEGWLIDNIISFDGYLSTTNKKEDLDINVFPNPTSDVLYFESTTLNNDYRIFDVGGKLVQNGVADNVIPVSNLQKGIYFVKIGDNNWSKFIKK